VSVADQLARIAAAARPPRALDPDDGTWPVPMRRAAVIVMLRDRDGELVVPMIVRGDDAPVHSGQTALPGGRWEPRDASLIATAVREAEEEVGVTADRLRVLGELDDLPTRTGFIVRAVIAVLDREGLRPDSREVQETFEVPLATFLDRTRAEDLGVRELGNVSYALRRYRHGEREIWGVAARILEIVAAIAAGEDASAD
jgi:8-oxo-dGTP pyrophosphatase MutT (NUDIX family)